MKWKNLLQRSRELWDFPRKELCPEAVIKRESEKKAESPRLQGRDVRVKVREESPTADNLEMTMPERFQYKIFPSSLPEMIFSELTNTSPTTGLPLCIPYARESPLPIHSQTSTNPSSSPAERTIGSLDYPSLNFHQQQQLCHRLQWHHRGCS